MIEIIALIFLTKEIANLAESKGLKRSTWKLYTVLSWIIGEFIGAIVGVMIFGTDNLFSVALVAIAGAFTGYVFLKSQLKKKPDVMQDDIDNIGQQ